MAVLIVAPRVADGAAVSMMDDFTPIALQRVGTDV